MQDSNQINTVELKPPDFDRAANLLAEAFYHNPAHTYILGDINNRSRLLKWALKANLKQNLTPPNNIGHSFALVEANQQPGKRQIMAMAFWHPPGCDSLGLINKLRSGWFLIPWKLGKAGYQRLVEVTIAFDSIKANISNDKKAWYVNNMVVTKELRGTGLGTRVLGHQLESVVEPSGFPAILMTQRAENVTFYRRLGFEVATESKIGSGEAASTNWCMIRHVS